MGYHPLPYVVTLAGVIGPRESFTSREIQPETLWTARAVDLHAVMAYNARQDDKDDMIDPTGYEAASIMNFRRWDGWVECGIANYGRSLVVVVD